MVENSSENSNIHSKISRLENCLQLVVTSFSSSSSKCCGVELQIKESQLNFSLSVSSFPDNHKNYDLSFIYKKFDKNSKIKKETHKILFEEYFNSLKGGLEEKKQTCDMDSEFCLFYPVQIDGKKLLGFIYLINESQNSVFSSNEKYHFEKTAILIQSIFSLHQIASYCIQGDSKAINEPNMTSKNKASNDLGKLEDANQKLIDKINYLEQKVQIDKLTGLFNRTCFEERFSWLLDMAERNQYSLVVALIDLDDFKKINDTLGHKAGDQLLVTVAKRLKSCARKTDIVARLGGDEFALIINNPKNKKDALNFMERVLAEISTTIQLDHRMHLVSCSIGFSVYPDDANSTDELLKFADSAMYQAKKNGKGKFQYYSEELQQEIQNRIILESELNLAIKRKEFVLYFQPQMDMRTGAMVGIEALIRWNHPTRGLILPNEFIPLAEEIGLILIIGDWVFEQTCIQLDSWKSNSLPLIPISVNFSVNQLMQPDLVSHLKFILEKYNVDANLITVEITESLSLNAAEQQLQILISLKSVGVRISIDDFGTGYSNLNYLKRFPIDEIKIDKSFVDEITTDPHDKAIAKTIIAIAHNLKLTVVAEGVETKAQLSVLAKSGCDILQGYYFSKPLPEKNISKLLFNKELLDLEGIRPADYYRTVLIVDDEKNVRSSLNRLFRREKFKVLTASSAKEALEVLALNEVSVIISDLSMPEMGGIELLQLVQELHPYIIRIILSGQSDFEVACDAINRSAIHKFVTKPWSDDALKMDLESAFKLYEDQFY